MTEEQAQPSTGTSRSRASVAAKTNNNDEPVEQAAPAEIEHTPTLPQGQVSYYAEGANNTPIGVAPSLAPNVVEQAAPAAAALVSDAPTTLEIAAPAPLPRPGDENLQRGTAEGVALQAELTGVAPEMPLDPASPEARARDEEITQQRQEQSKEAAEAIAARREKMKEEREKVNQGRQKPEHK